MDYVIGQTIQDIITLRDTSGVAITGLAEDDFITLEAFLLSSPLTTELVALTEIDDGQYLVEFAPSNFGTWAFHYHYVDLPTDREDTLKYQVKSTAEIVVVTSGGTWTYTGDLSDPMQEVRFLIQDTDGSHPLFVDTEVAYALGIGASNTRRAAVFLVERLLSRYRDMADTTELDLSVRASQLYDHAKDSLARLKNPFINGGSVRPYAGGISKADIQVNEANTDRQVGVFDRTNPLWQRVP